MERPTIDELCRQSGPRLVLSLAAYVGDRAVAEELAQEALARAWERWDDVSAYESAEAWLFRTARNLATSVLRRRMIERRAQRLRIAGEADAVDGDDVGSSVADSLAVRTAVAALPERQRAVISARYLLGLSVRESAAALGCSEGTIKSNTSDALENLRVAIGSASASATPEGSVR